tara:strand:+ start:537 stop:854 length:318 start_codon:yes stop_codon:yes gene_type:complete
MVMYKKLNGVTVELTSAEEQEVLADREQARLERPANQLREIRMLRNQKLEETDFWVLRGNITTAQSDYRQALRDIPSTYSESDYDSLLAVNENGELTHTVWSKPE